ncbi:deferrochelatase/peroxidase EfeB [Antricoccus suffuscus]|uniref:Deferrochelatase/peroxidase EfeB n=1 Tax=Antricoccus suffuscus TaxID=1629062 RepID=A0A2T0Z2B9_9ACTN|nr:deferrochelatase/peroxidase EfeB [Antricoccus suffuscus]
MTALIGRRRFLAGAAAVAGTSVFAGCTADGGQKQPAAEGTSSKTNGLSQGKNGAREEFFGTHQMGILPGPASYGVAVAFDCLAPDRAALGECLKTISDLIHELTLSRPAVPDTADEDNGMLLGLKDKLLSGTVSVGASLFDGRYGLAALKPTELVPMPDGLARDELRPEQLHGDILVLLQGDQIDIPVHALRVLRRATAKWLKLRWAQDVFIRPDTDPKPNAVTSRNLMGFKDGTANPDVTVNDLMAEIVWSGSSEPVWASGGSYQVVRKFRMLIEDWDGSSLGKQQHVFGRQKVTGAPLDGKVEEDVPIYAKDPEGAVTPLNAHIRLANPRDGAAKLMLRRGMNYSGGVDADGNLDQGLLFISYQATLAAFIETQARLKGEALEEFVITTGGGFFFALPGPEKGGYVGKQLIEAA